MKIYQSDFISKDAYSNLKESVQEALDSVQNARKFTHRTFVTDKGGRIEETLWKCHLGLENLEFVD